MRTEYAKEAPPVLLEFLNYAETIQGRSSLTVDEYYVDLKIFFRFLIKDRGLLKEEVPDEEIDLSIVDINMVESVSFSEIVLFMNYCQQDRHNNNRTRARKTSALRQFFNYYAVKTQKISHNPTDALSTPKLPKQLPKYLTLAESLQLLDTIDGRQKERDYCIVVFFLNCGLRVSELCGINLSDINSEHILTVRGKGNKERELYLNDACMDALERYMAVRDEAEAKDKNPLFISQKKGRMTPKGVQYVIDRCMKRAGMGSRGISPHKLRHTAATLMYQKGGADIRTLQTILGHESLATTQIYTHVADGQMADAMKANPLGKKQEEADGSSDE